MQFCKQAKVCAGACGRNTVKIDSYMNKIRKFNDDKLKYIHKKY